ncbi:helix-turn-helix transcriptional regulator [Microbacterium sp. NEAU-LLC]|uniref:Helix-turn-helix transcriptional regulator n=1 Tax=Microbacterium helvum TaxID=2773713 RepID=A0ABR8NTY5_9MICO|nr:AraC family transcriptional regulator [Microbacterium helvum]MBD3943513.1 helix-turn-helix transcriptional regulator [Microbacterium helvum]
MKKAAAAPHAPRTDADDDALEHLLAAVDVHIRRQRRMRLDDAELLALDAGAITFAYVLSGELQMGLAGERAERLPVGDILLLSGRGRGTLTAHGPATVLLSELDLADEAAHLLSLLPDHAIVRSFAELEPAAAAMLPHMGYDAEVQQLAKRGGDFVVCRMMAVTVLISVIRAWAAGGCAPEGWPTASSDPFLDRVVAAIHADPGREWTVETLAAVGAMSRSAFAERFRLRYGRSPAGYVTAVRMRAAQDLLSRGRGISAVSRELGYASDEGFSRAFRRSVGTTPSAWRSAHRFASA